MNNPRRDCGDGSDGYRIADAPDHVPVGPKFDRVTIERDSGYPDCLSRWNLEPVSYPGPQRIQNDVTSGIGKSSRYRVRIKRGFPEIGGKEGQRENIPSSVQGRGIDSRCVVSEVGAE